MLLGQELKFKNKLCNLKLGTFFSALPGLGASALSGRFNRTVSSKFVFLPPVLLADYKSAKTARVKSGEEWVKSAQTLFTPRNADKHWGFRPKGEE